MSVFGRLFNLGRGVVSQVTKPKDARAAEAERIARLEKELAERQRPPERDEEPAEADGVPLSPEPDVEDEPPAEEIDPTQPRPRRL